MKFSDYEMEAKKKGVGGDIWKPKEGENRIKIASEPEGFGQHFMGKGQASLICLGTSCVECKKGEKPTFKIMLYIIDRTDPTAKIQLTILSWSIFKKLGKYSKSTDYGFEGLPPYDINLIREGEGEATRYDVLPTPNIQPLTEAQVEDLKKRKTATELIKTMSEKAWGKQHTPDMPEEPVPSDLPFD